MVKGFLSPQELYHELHALDRFEQDYQRKREEEDNSSATHSGNWGVPPLTLYATLVSDKQFLS